MTIVAHSLTLPRFTLNTVPLSPPPLPNAHTHCVEAVVDNVLEVLAHAYLPHQLVLVPVHPRQLAHVSIRVLYTIRKLEKKRKQ